MLNPKLNRRKHTTPYNSHRGRKSERKSDFLMEDCVLNQTYRMIRVSRAWKGIDDRWIWLNIKWRQYTFSSVMPMSVWTKRVFANLPHTQWFVAARSLSGFRLRTTQLYCPFQPCQFLQGFEITFFSFIGFSFIFFFLPFFVRCHFCLVDAINGSFYICGNHVWNKILNRKHLRQTFRFLLHEIMHLLQREFG